MASNREGHRHQRVDTYRGSTKIAAFTRCSAMQRCFPSLLNRSCSLERLTKLQNGTHTRAPFFIIRIPLDWLLSVQPGHRSFLNQLHPNWLHKRTAAFSPLDHLLKPDAQSHAPLLSGPRHLSSSLHASLCLSLSFYVQCTCFRRNAVHVHLCTAEAHRSSLSPAFYSRFYPPSSNAMSNRNGEQRVNCNREREREENWW